MNIETDTDTIDGKNPVRQAFLWGFYILGTIASFYAIQSTILALIGYALGAESANKFEPWAIIPTLLLLGKLLQTFESEFWVNPTGNHILPTINIFFPGTVNDEEDEDATTNNTESEEDEVKQNGGTRFIVYTTGVALKWPWEKRFGVEIEVEREEIHTCIEDFTVSAKAGFSLIIKMTIAWKPYTTKLSSFLQSAGHNPKSPAILKQIAAKAQQLFEEYTANLEDSEDLRKSQTDAINKVMEKLRPFARKFGIETLDVSLTKCDYSEEDQKIRNKAMQGTLMVKLADELFKKGGYATHADASRVASLTLGAVNISDHKTTYAVEINTKGVTPETAEILGKMDLDALAVLIANKINGKK